MILSELIPFLKRVGAKPKKNLSQNFLIDPNIVHKIIYTAEIQTGDTVLEIGPGPGILTASLLEKGAYVYAVEIDPVLAKELGRLQNGKLKVFEADFLKFPMEILPKELKVVANLPYHITTPILEKIFSHPLFSLTMMVQKEIASRMSAQAGSKTFGTLSLFVQFYSRFHSSFAVSARCFYPSPKVDSTVIRVDFKKPPTVNPQLFFHFVHKTFQQRRKMLANSIGLPKEKVKEVLINLGLRPDSRPEEIPLGKWVGLTEKLSNLFLQDKKESPLHLFQSN